MEKTTSVKWHNEESLYGTKKFWKKIYFADIKSIISERIISVFSCLNQIQSIQGDWLFEKNRLTNRLGIQTIFVCVRKLDIAMINVICLTMTLGQWISFFHAGYAHIHFANMLI